MRCEGLPSFVQKWRGWNSDCLKEVYYYRDMYVVGRVTTLINAPQLALLGIHYKAGIDIHMVVAGGCGTVVVRAAQL